MSKKRSEHAPSSKILFMILAVLLVILLWKFAVVSFQLIQNQSNISTLRTSLEDLQHQQDLLNRMEQFFQSDYFAEREARLKYGMQKKGETAVIITQEKRSDSIGGDAQTGFRNESKNSALPNPRQWWFYFFGKE